MNSIVVPVLFFWIFLLFYFNSFQQNLKTVLNAQKDTKSFSLKLWLENNTEIFNLFNTCPCCEMLLWAYYSILVPSVRWDKAVELQYSLSMLVTVGVRAERVKSMVKINKK